MKITIYDWSTRTQDPLGGAIGTHISPACQGCHQAYRAYAPGRWVWGRRCW